MGKLRASIIVLWLLLGVHQAAAAVHDANGSCGVHKTCVDGLIIPAWQPIHNISTGEMVGRALIYFISMCYMFLGVSIVADRFMAAIEVVTSKERVVVVKKKVTGEPYKILVRVWNETVSNLSLMALGSSAPEILLSVIEIFGNKFEAGELGPSTIVGSAAFNMFIIIAVSVMVIPNNEVRRIKHIYVFWVTVSWSLFAYIWLYMILAVFSPGVVEVWEGVLTFIFFPLTVLTAWAADRRMFGLLGRRFITTGRPFTGIRSPSRERNALNGGEGVVIETDPESVPLDPEAREFEDHRNRYIAIFRQLRSENPDAPIHYIERLAEEKMLKEGPKSRAFYRIQATRRLVGAGDVIAQHHKKIGALTSNQKKGGGVDGGGLQEPAFKGFVVVHFDPGHYTCLENVGTMFVTVACDRSGLSQQPCIVEVDYKTIDGTANAGSDYKPTVGTLQFNPDETRKNIGIDIVDNDIYEEDEQFYVQLSNIRATPVRVLEDGKVEPVQGRALLSSKVVTPATAAIIIIDNDHAGAFGFEAVKYKVPESAGKLDVKVVRTRGARGSVSIPYKTVDGAAKGGKDYTSLDSVLHFKDEQTFAEIQIEIINDDEYEKSEDFYIELGEPIWENPPTDEEAVNRAPGEDDGHPVLSEMSRCRVTITESKEFKSFVDKMLASANSSVLVGTSSWKQQFAEAISVDGGGEEGAESVAAPSLGDYVMHALTVPWKLIFALIPPTDYYGGWLCFVVSVFCIGVCTAIIGDLASMFGCTVGMKDSVTAISLVALGTSIPDTFASKTAAVQDPYADSSVGNVTGSNAVNVFLGIGIAWAIAAIYHAFNGTVFRVEAGSLAFSVTMFMIGAIICITVLQLRRFYSGIRGELGGPASFKYITCVLFICLWLGYLIASALEAYCVIEGF